MNIRNLIIALAATGLTPQAIATDPPDGTITEQTRQQTATGGPYATSNPTPVPLVTTEPDCSAPESCDEYLLTLDLSPAYRDANPNAVIVIDLISNDGDDLDMYVYDDQDNLIAQGATESASETAIARVSDIPSTARVVIVPFTASGGTADLILTLGQGSGSGEPAADPCAVEDEANEGSAVLDDAVRQDFTSLGGDAVYGAFVHFNLGDTAYQDAILASRGLTVQKDFRKYTRAVYVFGPVSAFQALSLHPAVSRIEHNKPLRYFGETAIWASRAAAAREAVSGGPYFDAGGNLLDGTGVTLGVIDGGLQGLHPDFGNLLANFRVAGPNVLGVEGFPTYVDVGPTSSEAPGGGHGTHVAGIVAGQGLQSDGGYPNPDVAPNMPGTFTGVAPQARIVNWGNGLGLVVLSAATSYEHLLENEESFDPPLRAVNNSYGDITPGTPYDPGSVASCLIKEIVNERGIVMAFAAGNDGGDGTDDMTSGQCKDPTPGVICVAMYDDLNAGERNGPLSSGSSRGESGKPETYPDIAAPGVSYTSTCLQGDSSQALCTSGQGNAVEDRWVPYYGTISGTSMATPHITGLIGLILQARPELTPAEVEAVIQRTARKIGDGYEADPQLNGNTVNVGYGAGLVDLPSVLDELGVGRAGLPPVGEPFVVIDGDTDAGDASDVVTVTLQDMSIDGRTGIAYQLTLADATDLGGVDPIAYRITRNLAGKPASTTVLLGASGPQIAEPGEGNDSIASSVTLDNNVLTVFVDHVQQGAPAIGEPVHNLQVLSLDAGTVLDIAPSAAGNDPATPMFARAFTSLLPPGLAPPSDETSCELPGLTKIISPPGTAFNSTETGQEDIRQGWLAEPTDLPGTLAFTMKVDNLSPQPITQRRWLFYFNVPGDDNNYFIAMDTFSGLPEFIYGTSGSIEGTVGTFETLGTINEASNFTTDGFITLVLDKDVLGITTGMEIDGIAAQVRTVSNPANGSGLQVDAAGAQEGYVTVGNDTCASPSGVTGVTNTVAASAAPGSSGGGGAFGVATLALLLVFGWRRRRWH